MENIEIRIIELAISVSILFFLFPFLLWIHNIVDMLKLSKINSFEDFKEKMKWRILPGKKLFKPATWFKPTTLTMEEIVRELIETEEKLKNKRFINITLKIILVFIFFSVYVSLAKNIGYYYLRLKGYEILQNEYILGNLATLVLLSSWIALVLFRKLAINRIHLFLKKFREFEDALK